QVRARRGERLRDALHQHRFWSVSGHANLLPPASRGRQELNAYADARNDELVRAYRCQFEGVAVGAGVRRCDQLAIAKKYAPEIPFRDITIEAYPACQLLAGQGHLRLWRGHDALG